ncbi:MAG: tetratricopeptide repeat protein [Deltaproteobacteria bacterium]|nr:tetratricopeptide repeat protein [Deltaproteobacteria bacterium]
MLRNPFVLLTLPLLLTGCPRDPAGARIHYDLGIQASSEGRIQDAVKSLRESVEKDPNFPDARNALGLLYHVSLARPDLAEPEYQKALDLKPEYSEAANNYCALLLDLKRYGEAETLCRQALANVLYPTPHLARGNLAMAMFHQGRVEDAITELKAALITQPKFCAGYRNLGNIYQEIDQAGAALGAYEKFAEHCPENATAQHLLGEARLRTGDVSGAKAAFERCSALADTGLSSNLGEQCRRSRAALESAGAAGLIGE